MTASSANKMERAPALRESAWLLALLLLGMTGVVAIARWTEGQRLAAAEMVPAEEQLYVKGAAAKRLSLAFNAIMADWYWMRSLQYIGRKAVKHEKIRLDNLSELDLKLLAPLLDTAATLDPKFMPVYEYGAVVLPTVSDQDQDEDAIALMKKGIAANPEAWRLHYHLGYIHWQRGDYRAASEAYGEGAKVAGAPPWMKTMELNMLARGASPQVAREIYERMRAQADDEQVRLFAEYRLAQLDSMDERERIRRVLADYTASAVGRCPTAWREVAPQLRAAGIRIDSTGSPLDPTDVPYVLVGQDCAVELHPESRIPRK
jgi:hypothetical protein